MTLLTAAAIRQLLENGARQKRVKGTSREIDFKPAAKLFTPDAGCTWLLTELDPDAPSIAFGLCDLGFGCPELGSVDLDELRSVRGPLGLLIEQDQCFVPKKTLRGYADEARAAGRIRA